MAHRQPLPNLSGLCIVRHPTVDTGAPKGRGTGKGSGGGRGGRGGRGKGKGKDEDEDRQVIAPSPFGGPPSAKIPKNAQTAGYWKDKIEEFWREKPYLRGALKRRLLDLLRKKYQQYNLFADVDVDTVDDYVEAPLPRALVVALLGRTATVADRLRWKYNQLEEGEEELEQMRTKRKRESQEGSMSKAVEKALRLEKQDENDALDKPRMMKPDRLTDDDEEELKKKWPEDAQFLRAPGAATAPACCMRR